jgi:hypothetical protein
LVIWKLPSSPRKKKPQQYRSKGKVMLELFFIHMEFITEGASVSKHCYKEIIHRLCSSVHHKHPVLLHKKNWLLLHDNAPAHQSVLVQEELAKQQGTVLPHCPYSPDPTSCNFILFPCLKEELRGHRFQSAEEIVIATREAIWDLLANIFQQCSSSYTNIGRIAYRPTATILREDVDMCKCM